MLSIDQMSLTDLRKRVTILQSDLRQTKQQNSMYQKYIESLLDYNGQLVYIIENELNLADKITTLCPISEKSENVQCRSYTAKMTEENQSVKQAIVHDPQISRIQGEINMLLDIYNDKFLKSKQVTQSQLKEVINLMEKDKQQYKSFHQNSMQRLQAKQYELAAILHQLRSSIDQSAGRPFSERMRNHAYK